MALIHKLSKRTTVNSGVFVLRPKNNDYIPQFVYYVLLSFIFNRFISNLKAGSTISHLYQKNFINFKFPIPDSTEEQHKIVNILSSVEKNIEKQTIQKKELELLKKGLMQILLTGKVRVKIN